LAASRSLWHDGMVIDVLAAVLIGTAIGFLAGLFGVGGSSVSTPLLRVLLGTPRLIALGSPLPVTIPAAIAGSIANYRKGLINRRVVGWAVAGGIPAIVLGSLLTKWVPESWLMYLIAGGVILAGIRLVGHGIAATEYGSERWMRASAVELVMVAVVVGFLSGLLANGGGFLLVPAYVIIFGARMREAAATSLPCVALLAVPGTATHALLGHIDGWLTLELSIGVIPATYLGAQLSLRRRDISLRRPFGLFMLGFGLYFVIRELR
jgi:uncharacterized membrane protein YfcA